MVFKILINRVGGYFGLRETYLSTNSNFKKKILLIIHRGFQHETGSFLPLNNIINGPINFLHGTYGIFISGGAVIGKNCTMYHQVTIGSNMLLDSKGFGAPTVGDNCLIGAGAKIIGGIKIGNNCRIGSNTVVTTDLPDNSVIVNAPAQIIQKNELTNKIYQKSNKVWGYQENGGFVIEKDDFIITKLNNLIGK